MTPKYFSLLKAEEPKQGLWGNGFIGCIVKKCIDPQNLKTCNHAVSNQTSEKMQNKSTVKRIWCYSTQNRPPMNVQWYYIPWTIDIIKARILSKHGFCFIERFFASETSIYQLHHNTILQVVRLWIYYIHKSYPFYKWHIFV